MAQPRQRFRHPRLGTFSTLALTLALALIVWLLAIAARAEAAPYATPKGKVWHGVSDTSDVADFSAFRKQVGAHPALLQVFYHWDVSLKASHAFERWAATDTRGVVSLSTASGDGTERITPAQIADGRGDDYILRLNESIANQGQIVYLRLFPEMNGYWNPYSAFNRNGSARKGHSTKQFKQAWRRISLIVDGGARKRINADLRRLKMLRILRATSEHDPVYRRNGIPAKLERAKVATMWVPQTSGSPNKKANRPQAYFPGKRYVDWVGADIYAKFSTKTVWRNFNRFYSQYRQFPFVVGEYGPYDRDPKGRFVKRLFEWAEHHKRTRALLFYRSVSTDNIYNLHHYPGARKALIRILNERRYQEFAPGAKQQTAVPFP